MQKKTTGIGLTLLLGCTFALKAQYHEKEGRFPRWFAGSSGFLLGNLASTNSPDFVQVNVGFRLTGKDVITLEPKTWKTAWPIGIHPFFNKAYGTPEEEFPGYIRDWGISLAYQRFFWRGLYAELNCMPTWQFFVNEKGKTIEEGFQIFNTYRVGYHIKLFKDRFFIQPSLAITHRPFHTRMPDGFRQKDNKWSKFVFGEPGFHFGFNF